MEVLEELRFTHTFWAIVLPCILMILDIITGDENIPVRTIVDIVNTASFWKF